MSRLICVDFVVPAGYYAKSSDSQYSWTRIMQKWLFPLRFSDKVYEVL